MHSIAIIIMCICFIAALALIIVWYKTNKDNKCFRNWRLIIGIFLMLAGKLNKIKKYNIRRGSVDIIVISMVEIMSQLKLDHHGKPGSTGCVFHFIVGLISSAHPRSRPPRDSNQGPISLTRECLTTRPLGWFESRKERDRGRTLLMSPPIGGNGRPVLPGFPWWSSFN
ncbi:unnamed protein product [Schistosoma curassoni]|uniref:DUF1294 domain-containing protein n=1 Tax=Schistosoma curassoni TaxID=6186 RepID=A0A183KHF6_9TREM|nr:unnamed protein product [Schistosoma curassoni]